MTSGVSNGRMFLVDAHSLIFQVFHAIPAMSSPSGLPTNALFGFTRDLLFLQQTKNPDYLLCAFDEPGPTFRDQLYSEYKAHRAPMPEDLRPQLPLIRQLVEAMGIPVLSRVGFEADDVIATVARVAAERGIEVMICTSDKDCRQLINDRVKIYSLRKHEILDREALRRDWEIAPEQVVDLQALVGDSVDNVPGVPGIGLKTASKLLQEFGTLDNIMANVDRVAGAKRQENLRAFADKIGLSRQLVRLAADVPLDLDWDGWKRRGPDAARLLALFEEWGFHRFAEQVRTRVRARTTRQGELFPAGDGDKAPRKDGRSAPVEPRAPVQPTWEATYHLVDKPEKLKAFLSLLQKQRRLAFDLETTSLEPRRAKLVGLAFSWQPGEAWYVAVRGPAGEPVLDPARTVAQLQGVFEDPNVTKINQNIKYDMIVLREHGVELAGLAGDSMVADYLLHAGERSHSMEDLSNRYLQHRVIPITDLIGKRGKGQLRMDQVSPARVAIYAGEDADVAWRLCNLLEPRLTMEKLDGLYRDVEVPLIRVLAELEYNGVRLDVPKLNALGQEMASQLAAIEQEIHALAGRPFNIASPRQLRQVLFDELRLPTQRRTGITGEASTAQASLERLAGLGHPLPRKILEHRHIAKLKGTYVDALPGLINPQTGRVHASFNQTVTSTGRLSSSDPNLQNIPVRTEQGRQIRQAFIPAEGWRLLTADYSQIELRLLAHFSGDPALRQAFAESRDIHGAVAAQVFGVAEGEVTPDMRRAAKTVNFGVIYGISPHGLAPRLGISLEEAAKFIDSYFARYPCVEQYQAHVLKSCLRDRCVSTILGRRREISGIRPDSTYQQRNQPEREAINMGIQGSAADLIKVAMLNISRRLKEDRRQARMLLQIHDELVFEVPPEELEPVAKMVTHEMTTALPLDVPLQVDVAAGSNWLDVEEVKL